MGKFIETADDGYVNADHVVEIRVSKCIGFTDTYQIEAWMTELGWTTIKDGFKTKSLAKDALFKLVNELQK